MARGREDIFSLFIKSILQYQNHTQKYEKVICLHSYTANTNEKFALSGFFVNVSSVRMKTNKLIYNHLIVMITFPSADTSLP